jgi:16S rRNA (uracil1498-N3)-methyltransferase
VAVPAARAGEALWLERGASRHLVRVLRMRPGDAVVAFTPEGREYEGRIAAVERGRVCLEIGSERERKAGGAGVRVRLGFSPPKPQRADWLVEKATELGAGELVPVLCARTQGERAGMAAGRRARWGRIAREAAEQSGRAGLPEIAGPVALADFLRDAGEGLKLVADRGPGSRPLPEVMGEAGEAAGVVLLVGPEGGLTEGEVRAAEAAGFVRARLGRTILRTETAALAALAGVVMGEGVDRGEGPR